MQNPLCLVRRRMRVVGNHDDGDSVIAVDMLNQPIHLRRCEGIQPRNRFVEDDQFSGCGQRARQQGALLLPTGELTETRILQRIHADADHLRVCNIPLLFRIKRAKTEGVEGAGEHDLLHACGKVPLPVPLLRQVANLSRFQPVAERNRPGGRRLEPQQPFDQRALSGTVFSDHAEIIPALYGEGQIAHNLFAVVTKRGVCYLNQCHFK
ncbi:hypothetical protein SDC9_160250 [bioreactor metagenome]|uniref:Uncharacterized protein n=1 Tax=bioreactor metagenome TaxID=1076179 RepID=A0A645FG53_9ZZZZ